MSLILRVDNPATLEAACEIQMADARDLERVIALASAAQRALAASSLAERVALVERAMELALAEAPEIAREVTLQMGKPISEAQGEVNTMVARARELCRLAPEALAPRSLEPKANFERWVERVPVGIVLNIAPWNYPLLTVINALVASVLAGNAFILKHSPRTPLCGLRLQSLFERAGAPAGLVTALLVDHPTAAQLMAHPAIGYVAFTGSVRGGREVYRAVAQSRFIDVGLELGGKDAAYVLEDAPFEFAVANVVEGGLYNAGQSCCAVERVYVARSLFPRFVEAAVEAVRSWVPGDPTELSTTLGPMALPEAPAFLTGQVAEAKSRGARVLTGGGPTTVAGRGRFFEPTLLVDVSDDMRVMREESFGPVLGILPVDDDAEAVRRINDSPYGLTASLWTRDTERARGLARQLDVGTVFQNRCDFLDPGLPWNGHKDSGKGATLGLEGFAAFTRLRNLHFRTHVG
jgi:acyl-CoA reductase-like NAD-dependent aldehyde dehydrogenase